MDLLDYNWLLMSYLYDYRERPSSKKAPEAQGQASPHGIVDEIAQATIELPSLKY